MCSERQAENSWGLTVLDWFDQPKTCREDFFETVADQVELKWIGSFPEKKKRKHTYHGEANIDLQRVGSKKILD